MHGSSDRTCGASRLQLLPPCGMPEDSNCFEIVSMSLAMAASQLRSESFFWNE